ncbi:class I SAM-dependent methyltransferase [Roseovarius gahaiensis]|nr:class I SAM-dependent methyltransferase [Roseovarius gahaiensis]
MTTQHPKTGILGIKTMNKSAESNYQSGSYWRERSDMLYYRYIDYIMRCVSVSAQSMIDVGTGNCPYMEWFDWIPERVSVDIRIPYQSEHVKGVKGDIFEMTFDRAFDICTCLQVLEHVPEADRFARRLLELGELVIVSVPYNWPGGEEQTAGHVHDPVDYDKLTDWMGRPANYHVVVEEPFGNRAARPAPTSRRGHPD